jgi:hypothetical protein
MNRYTRPANDMAQMMVSAVQPGRRLLLNETT